MKNYKSELSQNEFEEIERYILGQMEDREVLDFELRLQSSPELQNEILLQKQLLGYIEVNNYLANDTGSKEKVIPIAFWKIGIAASLLLLLSFAIWIFVQPQSSASEKLYVANFYPDPGLPVAMSLSDDFFFEEGMVSYKEEDYEKAIELWSKLESHIGDTDTLNYYIAMAKLNIGQFELAATQLDSLIERTDSEFRDKAIWYSALIFLKKEDRESAIQMLQKIKEVPRAAQLLESLNEL